MSDLIGRRVLEGMLGAMVWLLVHAACRSAQTPRPEESQTHLDPAVVTLTRTVTT